ncbi:flagellar hook-associated protein FlgL [Paraferrimonas sedimenticola]|uniref:Flagellar hook-associated protein FlgL n=1 Tax=Paraferrimonas sedimenticola TaxID=375674 RepID=A0AA37RPT5_9GAMM|nr:flagellar hook-associated protein FlgL [Paraferrimonas sedimenticola]GLP94985.1 flagellar hook-associated protein FlgL [Paraferrimonas sedimenticola]
MRISTNLLYFNSHSQLSKTQNLLNQTMEQLATGKKVNTAGDDPIAAIAINNLNQQNRLAEQYLSNIDYARNRLSLNEAKMGEADSLLNNVKELMLRANNGQLTADEKGLLSDEMNNLVDELVAIGNTKDASGNYVFGGHQQGEAPFVRQADGTVVFRGDAGKLEALVDDGVRIDTSTSGLDMLMQIANPSGDYRASYDAGNTGDGFLESAKITDPANHTADDFRYQFVGDGSGGMELQVLDSGGNTVHTQSPFDPSQPLKFNGMEVQFSGTPEIGDVIDTTPGSSFDVFSSLNQAIDLLNADPGLESPAGQKELAQLLNDIDQGLASIHLKRGEFGNTLKSLDSFQQAHEETRLLNETALSPLQDVDYAEAITLFEQQMLALNAVNNTFSKVNTISLFNYI